MRSAQSPDNASLAGPPAVNGRSDHRGLLAAEVPDPLRRDVRLLGDALGTVLTESGGAGLLADVERLRRAVIAARAGEEGGDDPMAVTSSLDPARAEQVAKAFSVYFHLVNLAEERHRVRALRARAVGAPRGDDFAAIAADLPAERLRALLSNLRVHPVLTAHPTEARRRAVVVAVARIGDLLDRLDDPRSGDAERAETARRLLEEVTVLWRTEPVRRRRPGPLDEVRAAMAVFDASLFRMVPQLYRSFEIALGAPGDGGAPARIPAYLRYGSWIGGDRDGNPTVTASITSQTLEIQADHALRALTNATTRIGRTLTLDADETPPSPALLAALGRAQETVPDIFGDLATSAPNEPHRQWLLLAATRLKATRLEPTRLEAVRAGDAALAYPCAGDFLADLRLAQDSLAAAGAARAAYGELQHLIWQAETFGFHLAELEIRQHSDVHRRALAATVGAVAAADPGALDRLALDGSSLEAVPDDADLREVLETIRVMAALQERWGERACSRYVVSFTSWPSDLVAVRALARLAIGDRPLALDVVPLFETEADLRRAPAVLDGYLALPSTRARLLQNGNRLEVMLGYSDSAKDVGPLTVTLLLYETEAALTAWAERLGVALTLFHGRGGAFGRGGGPAGRAVLSSAPGSVAGRFKVTEQGEVIHARYGHAPIAVRHLEQVTTAVLRASSPEVEARNAAAAIRFEGLASRISAAARAAYRELVEADGFPHFFSSVSPLEEASGLQIGSRPARRRADADLASLRAIPWVFAWSQVRCNLPGWYGVGSGLAAAGDAETLRFAYREWPLFASLVDNVEMSLAKADRGIAKRHLALGRRPDLAETILAELDLTTEMIGAVTGRSRLLEGHRVLARAVGLRNPYVDALSHLQLRALTALREGTDVESNGRLLLLTMGGIAAGLQNTG